MSENEFESLEQDAINKAMKTLDSNPYISGLEYSNQKLGFLSPEESAEH